MALWKSIGILILACCFVAGCAEHPSEEVAQSNDEPATTVATESASESAALQLRLKSAEYCGGENDKHWQLTIWELKNISSQPVDEAVVMVSLFDNDGEFLGHHSVTFGQLRPGEAETQKRLLFLKSDNVGDWKSRFESIHSRTHGDVTHEFTLNSDPGEHAS